MVPKTTVDTPERIPPQNIEAEQGVLGAIFLDNDALLAAIDMLTVEDFYRDSHRKIYAATLALFNENKPVDIVGVIDRLRADGNLELVGGEAYIKSLAVSAPTIANTSFHSAIVRDKSLKRRIIRGAMEAQQSAYEDSLPAEQVLHLAENNVFQLSNERTKSAFVHIKDIIKRNFEDIEGAYARGGTVTGEPTGFHDLDKILGGLQKSDLIILGGRPGNGKTAFALGIAEHVGIHRKEPVVFFSLEMAKEQLGHRILCSQAMCDSKSIRSGFVRRDEWPKLTSAAGRIAEGQIEIDDSAALTVVDIRARLKRMAKKYNDQIAVVIVDYLQLMTGDRANKRYGSREQEVAEMSRGLKMLAKEFNVPIVALSQLNRNVEQRTSKIPTLADLRESGAIEQDSDVILFIHRGDLSKKGGDKDEEGPQPVSDREPANIIVAKHRNGPTGIAQMLFYPKASKFLNYEHETIEAF